MSEILATGGAHGVTRPASARWAGRTKLYVSEVAIQLQVTSRHVIDLIEEGELKAVNVAGAGERNSWRVPVEALEEFERRKGN